MVEEYLRSVLFYFLLISKVSFEDSESTKNVILKLSLLNYTLLESKFVSRTVKLHTTLLTAFFRLSGVITK